MTLSEYAVKLRAYACTVCGRAPIDLPESSLDGRLMGDCPSDGYTQFRMLSLNGARPYTQNRSQFDVDAKRVDFIEGTVMEMLRTVGVNQVECKHDTQGWQTGNIFVEYSRKDYHDGTLTLTGIAITTAEVVVYTMDSRSEVWILDTKKLLTKVEDMLEHGRSVWGGDGKRTLGVLIPIHELSNLYVDGLWDPKN